MDQATAGCGWTDGARPIVGLVFKLHASAPGTQGSA